MGRQIERVLFTNEVQQLPDRDRSYLSLRVSPNARSRPRSVRIKQVGAEKLPRGAIDLDPLQVPTRRFNPACPELERLLFEIANLRSPF